jgi:hypothetical protein
MDRCQGLLNPRLRTKTTSELHRSPSENPCLHPPKALFYPLQTPVLPPQNPCFTPSKTTLGPIFDRVCPFFAHSKTILNHSWTPPNHFANHLPPRQGAQKRAKTCHGTPNLAPRPPVVANHRGFGDFDDLDDLHHGMACASVVGRVALAQQRMRELYRESPATRTLKASSRTRWRPVKAGRWRESARLPVQNGRLGSINGGQEM